MIHALDKGMGGENNFVLQRKTMFGVEVDKGRKEKVLDFHTFYCWPYIMRMSKKTKDKKNN